MSGLTTCPACEGRGREEAVACGPLGCRTVRVACSLCLGDGEVSPTRATWFDMAQYVRRARLDIGLTLRRAAELVEMTPTDLSKCEQGLRDPGEVIRRLAALSLDADTDADA